MTLVRCNLLGAGTSADPFRCPWPTYHLIEMDSVTRRALCLVPDEDIPPANGGVYTHPDGLSINAPPRVVPPAAVTALNALLDRRYAEHLGFFRPIVM